MSTLIRLLALIYARYSGLTLESDESLDRQVKALQSIAASRGFETRDDLIVREVGSALDPARPGLSNLSDAVRRGEVGAVFVYDASRLSRDPVVLNEIIRECEAAGVELHCFHGPPLTGDTA